ncbi:annexin A2 isoform X1 [Fundulus heteroclitus]|uniref:Annexin A14 n=1 Tax=Fundulus heteroclitus TaxID=8078 RepID=A0A3Q2PW66_FUNHE|nr:annexin A2 isoform X1 [Fundulus heteroclitus]XP_036001609.1 annexin A2 isoform X1 [Fundulus heteroclitus]XP_036001610.1 annexin A2 isoform X1 [Fundulus heteroclitus]
MDPDFLASSVSNPEQDMWWGTLGTIRPFSSFHPDRDVAEIQAALQRKDAVTLVRILTNRSNAQRQFIAKSFQEQTKPESRQDLSAALKKALSGDLENLLLQLLMLPDQLEAHRLKDAMAGLGTDEETLLEILCTRSGQKLQDISAAYKKSYKKDLEKELRSETSGDFAKLVVALLKKDVAAGSVQRDVQALAASLSGKKAEAEPWITILTSRDADHLNKVLMELELETGQTVDQLVEKSFSGDFRLGLRVLVQCIQNPEVYLAQRLLTMKTPLVQGIMVSHSEEDLLQIRAAFLRLNGCSLYSALQKHFKGEHLQALQAICRSED